ncbi:YybH family protein [Tahibacter caeni]|uniref:YybH family protein n=1 Tax=Tahibacter caeni TaxID=1453545 RepID=UPI0021474A39|nr:SgcJ/EcaC family oxidoreductase [Tahibacter caeni]
MQDDEQQIRELVSAWMAASKTGDVDTVLSLMADDAVFLVAGRPPMHKADFAAAARAQARGDAPRFDGTNEIQELRVLGDWAFLWQRLTVTAVPPDGGESTVRSGHTLTIFRRQDGRWVLARDANLLAPAAQ